jgi:uncharacterized Ntn-hydrolase superfamily protein
MSGAVVPLARVGAGAIAWTAGSGAADPREAMDRLARGWDAKRVLDWFLDEDGNSRRAQIAIVDARGGTAGKSGVELEGWAGDLEGTAVAVLGREEYVQQDLYSMALAVQSGQDPLAERLLDALTLAAGQDGDRRFRSAALLVVRKNGSHGGAGDRYVDLRVDDSSDAVKELARLYTRHAQHTLPRMHEVLGDVALAAGDLRQANLEYTRTIDLYHKAIEARPGEVDFKLALAWFYVNHKFNLDEALVLATAARDHEPGSWRTVDTLAEVHFARGDLDGARELARQALALAPELAYLQRQFERFEHAIHSEGRP